VLIRFLVEQDPQFPVISTGIQKIFGAGESIFFTPQVARESWSVFTRPETVGGFGLEPQAAFELLGAANSAFTFLHDVPDVYNVWLTLVKAQGVSGRQVHDAYHVAAMMAHGLTKVLTLDKRDFSRYSQIKAVFPQDL